MEQEDLDRFTIDSPVGPVEVTGTDSGIRSVQFIDGEVSSGSVPESLELAIDQLKAYFQNQRADFDLRLDPEGTEFQKRVWQLLLEVPFGKTASYLDIARKLGDENATRAVGSANGKNPIAVIVPCHRIVGHDKSLTGYAGGLHRKRWLLEFEQGGVQGALF